MEDLSKRLKEECLVSDLAELKSAALKYIDPDIMYPKLEVPHSDISSASMSGDVLTLSDSDGEKMWVDLRELVPPETEELQARILEFRQILIGKPGMNQIVREYDEHFKLEVAREGRIDV